MEPTPEQIEQHIVSRTYAHEGLKCACGAPARGGHRPQGGKAVNLCARCMANDPKLRLIISRMMKEQGGTD